MIHPNGQINKTDILNGSYASSTSANESSNSIYDSTSSVSSNDLKNNETRTNDLTASGKEDEEYVKEKSGFDLKMTDTEKVLEYRKLLDNYNMQIIEECNSLFLAIF